MPVNVVLGSDPLVWFAASCPVAAGVSEFDFAGGLRAKPIEVIRSDLTACPTPRTRKSFSKARSGPAS